jgi:hypothetical protein
MSVESGDMWGALTFRSLSPDEVIVFSDAAETVQVDADGCDFLQVDWESGVVTFCGNLDALYDTLCEMAEEAEDGSGRRRATMRR